MQSGNSRFHEMADTGHVFSTFLSSFFNDKIDYSTYLPISLKNLQRKSKF